MNTKRIVSLVSVALFVAGCASNPYPKWSENRTKLDSIQAALNILEEDREAVRGRMREYGNAQIQAGNLMLGSGILAFVAASFHGHADSILAPSLLGASAYTINRYNDGTGPTAVYKAALQAFDCIEASVAPFDIGQKQTALLESTISDTGMVSRARLLVAIGAATKARDDYKRGKNAKADVVTSADALIAQGQAGITDSDAVRQDAHALYARISSLPVIISERGNSIRTAVDVAIREAQPKLDSIPALIGDLPRVVGTIRPVSGVTPLAADAAAKLNANTAQSFLSKKSGTQMSETAAIRLSSALSELAEAFATLNGEKVQLAALINSVAKRDDFERLKQCGIDASTLQAAMELVVDPANKNFGKDGGRQDFLVKGGTPPYVAGFSGTLAKGSISIMPPVNSGLFTIVVASGTSPGPYSLQLLDAKLKPIVIPISITDK